MDSNERLFHQADKPKEEDDWVYCNIGCKYEDSVGFCTFNRGDLAPMDSKCYVYTTTDWRPEGLVPDKFYKKKLKEKYGIK